MSWPRPSGPALVVLSVGLLARDELLGGELLFGLYEPAAPPAITPPGDPWGDIRAAGVSRQPHHPFNGGAYRSSYLGVSLAVLRAW